METYWVTSSDPLQEPEDYRRYQDAVARVKEIVAELEAEGYSCDCGMASERNMYAARCTKAGARTVDIQVNDEQE